MKDTTDSRGMPPPACEAAAAYHALAEAIGCPVFRTDGRGRLAEGNAAFAAWCGRPAAEVAGRAPADAGGPAATLAADVCRALAGERVERDGPAPAARTTLVPVRNERGAVTGVVGVVHPAGVDTVRLERVRRAARGVAHDINNLLTVVQASSSLLADDAAAARLPAPLLAAVSKAADHAKDLTGRLLDLCRPEPPGPGPVDLSDVVSDVATLLAPTAGRRVRLDVGPGREAPYVPGPRDELVRVLLNLCVNACDAMPAGGTLRVRAEAVPAGGPGAPPCLDGGAAFARLRVEDTGVGMAPEVRARVFEPGFTTKPPGGHSGIGLAVVDEVVRGRGGRVECLSVPGRGTTFDVYLPACPPRQPAAGR
jgi:signal transduction histidine kinase